MSAKIAELHPDLQPIAASVPNIPVNKKNLWLLRFVISLIRSWQVPKDMRIENHYIASQGKKIRLRHYQPKNPAPNMPCLLWLHGGGYVMGTPELSDAYCIELVQKLGIHIVSVAYRLAPDHPFPTPLDDGYAALQWLVAEAKALGIDKERLAVGGESAGAGLAAALCQLAHDRKEIRLAFQLLVYPMIDDRTVNQPELQGEYMVWNQANNRFGWESYLGSHFGTENIPDYAVPARRPDLSGLPPAWIGVGTLDLFHQENLAYAQRLQAANVPCHLEVVQGAFHGFDATAPKTQLVRTFRDSQLLSMKKYLLSET